MCAIDLWTSSNLDIKKENGNYCSCSCSKNVLQRVRCHKTIEAANKGVGHIHKKREGRRMDAGDKDPEEEKE